MQSVGKNASYVYLETMVRLFSGFLLWIFLSKISTPIVFVTRDFFYNQFSAGLLILSVSLAASTAFANLFSSIMVASLKLKLLPKIVVASSIVMMAVAISLVLLGQGSSGIILGYVCSYALFSILLVIYMRNIFGLTQKASLKLSCSMKTLLKASVPAWI